MSQPRYVWCKPVYSINEDFCSDISKEEGAHKFFLEIVGIRSIALDPKNLLIEPAIDTYSREVAILQGAHACQTTSPFIEQETVKGVSNQSEDGSKLIMIKMWCMFMWFLRELGKRSRIKEVKRDREPSRVPVRMLIWKMRKRLSRRKYKKIILKSIPVSCKTYHL